MTAAFVGTSYGPSFRFGRPGHAAYLGCCGALPAVTSWNSQCPLALLAGRRQQTDEQCPLHGDPLPSAMPRTRPRPAHACSSGGAIMYLTAHAVKHRGGGRRVGAVVVQARERALVRGPAPKLGVLGLTGLPAVGGAGSPGGWPGLPYCARSGVLTSLESAARYARLHPGRAIGLGPSPLCPQTYRRQRAGEGPLASLYRD